MTPHDATTRKTRKAIVIEESIYVYPDGRVAAFGDPPRSAVMVIARFAERIYAAQRDAKRR